MMKFLVYITIVLAILAVGYLVRVFELAQSLKGRRSEVITEGDNRNMAKVMLGLLIFLFGFTIWQLKEYGGKLLPEAASIHGVETDRLLNFNFAIIWIVFVLTQFLLFWFAFKYYGRNNNRASYFPHSNKLEMIWTVIPAIVLAVIIIFGLKTWNKIVEPAAPESTIVQIYSKQFDWTARYAGKDNVLGESNYKLITASNELGMADSKEGQDDIIVKNELHLPVNKEVEFKFNSRDVIHSAYFPHFRAQMNCVPGMTTMFHFTPTITTEEMRAKTGNDKFDYILLCNKICGNSHYNMQMTIIVETEEQYNKWLSEKKPYGTVATAEVK